MAFHAAAFILAQNCLIVAACLISMSAGPHNHKVAALGVCFSIQVTKTAPNRFSDLFIAVQRVDNGGCRGDSQKENNGKDEGDCCYWDANTLTTLTSKEAIKKSGVARGVTGMSDQHIPVGS